MGRRSRIVLALFALSVGCTAERRQTGETHPGPDEPGRVEAIWREQRSAADQFKANEKAREEQQERVERERKAQEASARPPATKENGQL